MPGDKPDPQLTALGREIERAIRRVDQVETLVRQLAAEVTSLAATGGDPEPEQTAGTRAWLLVEDPDQAQAVLGDLTQWLGRVYLRYPGAVLASCWLWHPGVVEELWWLRQAHAEAYSTREGSPTKVGDWHDRQRPGVVKRINTALGNCELALHDPPPPAPTVALAGSTNRIATTWASSRTSPHPTPAELTEAEQHHHPEHRTRHR